jgi:hypothetical protein
MTHVSSGSPAIRLSQTLAASLQALKEHSRKLLFESKAQAAGLLIRARNLDRWSANEHVQTLLAKDLIRIEKPKDDLQPRLIEFEPPEPRPAARQLPGRIGWARNRLRSADSDNRCHFSLWRGPHYCLLAGALRFNSSDQWSTRFSLVTCSSGLFSIRSIMKCCPSGVTS